MIEAKNGAEERIVAAAVQLFSRQGFQGTSTREIARLADVNEGTLFRHFARKIDLFWAAVHSQVVRVRLGRELERALADDIAPTNVFPLLFEFIITVAFYHSELMRLLQFSALELRPGAERVFRDELGPLFDSVTAYLERCVERGAIRPVDTFMTTVALVTTVTAHGGLHDLLTGNTLPFATSQEAITAYSNFWLTALVPEAARIQRAATAAPSQS